MMVKKSNPLPTISSIHSQELHHQYKKRYEKGDNERPDETTDDQYVKLLYQYLEVLSTNLHNST